MSADVSLHVSLLGKAFAADAARERLLFGVDRSDVCLEIALLCEAFAARVAPVVFFSGVNLHMGVHIALLCEAFAAYLIKCDKELQL